MLTMCWRCFTLELCLMLMYRDQQLKEFIHNGSACPVCAGPNGEWFGQCVYKLCVCHSCCDWGVLLFSWTIVTALMEASTAYGVKLRDLLRCVRCLVSFSVQLLLFLSRLTCLQSDISGLRESGTLGTLVYVWSCLSSVQLNGQAETALTNH